MALPHGYAAGEGEYAGRQGRLPMRWPGMRQDIPTFYTNMTAVWFRAGQSPDMINFKAYRIDPMCWGSFGYKLDGGPCPQSVPE